MAFYVLGVTYNNYNSADPSGHEEFVFEADGDEDAIRYLNSSELRHSYRFATDVGARLSRIQNFHHVNSDGVCDEYRRTVAVDSKTWEGVRLADGKTGVCEPCVERVAELARREE